jgi:hypothetical protein
MNNKIINEVNCKARGRKHLWTNLRHYAKLYAEESNIFRIVDIEAEIRISHFWLSRYSFRIKFVARALCFVKLRAMKMCPGGGGVGGGNEDQFLNFDRLARFTSGPL